MMNADFLLTACDDGDPVLGVLLPTLVHGPQVLWTTVTVWRVFDIVLFRELRPHIYSILKFCMGNIDVSEV